MSYNITVIFGLRILPVAAIW